MLTIYMFNLHELRHMLTVPITSTCSVLICYFYDSPVSSNFIGMV